MEDDERQEYKNIRDVPCLKAVIGKRLIDITENDDGEPATLFLMFEEATVIQVAIDEAGTLVVSPGGE